MSVQGELNILIEQKSDVFSSTIKSSRPTNAAQLFTGKTIKQSISLLPLLFNLCARAQTITAIKAIESQLNVQVPDEIIKQREIIIALERLREYSLPIFMQWPTYLKLELHNNILANLAQALNKLINSFDGYSLSHFDPNSINLPVLSTNQKKHWQHCKKLIEHAIFSITAEKWLNYTPDLLLDWAEKKQSLAAQFMWWLNKQPWKTTGKSTIKCLPENLTDHELLTLMLNNGVNFTANPQWNHQSYEVSSFNYTENKQSVALTKQYHNSLYSRMWLKLINIAQTIANLNELFNQKDNGNLSLPSSIKGLAHSFTARGRLTHYIELTENKIKRLLILAPTEWNFHPHGVAANSLNHLLLGDKYNLMQQANLIIQAIDPCVGFNITIKK